MDSNGGNRFTAWERKDGATGSSMTMAVICRAELRKH
jgi:hypothetical protein